MRFDMEQRDKALRRYKETLRRAFVIAAIVTFALCATIDVMTISHIQF